MRLLPLVLCLQSVVAQTCYNTDQTEHTLGIPCDPSGQSKQCCLYNSACLDNGLCLFGDDLGMNTGSCMDETWDHASCFSECRDATGPLHRENVVFRCGLFRWCCGVGGNGTSCCDDGEASTFVMPDLPKRMNYTITRTTNPATSSNSTESSEITQSCLPPAKQDDNNNKVVAAGVGVGIGVGLPLLAALAGLLILLRKEKRANAEMKASAAQTYPTDKSAHAAAPQGYSGQSGGYNGQPQELNGLKPLGELDNANEVGELAGGSR